MMLRHFALWLLSIGILCGQAVVVQMAPEVRYPTPVVDGNSPSVWVGDQLRVYTSTGEPLAMAGTGIFELEQVAAPEITPRDHYPIWIESVWRDDDGTIYGWYHHEPGGVCAGDKLTAPKIGAVISNDGGNTFRDLGIVLSTGYPINCGAQNGFFAGGHGDFSVIPDRDKRYFYFLFDNYSGPLEDQGVAIARMAFEDRAHPVGAVFKYRAGDWNEAGIGGLVTPIFPAHSSWEGSNTDAFWGPSVHWNTHLEAYVAVLNRACCKTGWPQEGIYVTVGKDLADPSSWTAPTQLLDARSIGFAPGYYPQVIGLEEGGTDSLAGAHARLFIKGVSKWEVYFFTLEEISQPPTEPPPDDPPEGRDSVDWRMVPLAP